MKILAHRGLWESHGEKNSPKAFMRSFKNGFGVECDIRDFNGNLVISHDIANADSMSVDDFFALYKEVLKDSNTLPLALNIKADGLQHLLKEALNKYRISNYFVFDMSLPDTLGYIKSNLQIFTRQSQYETQPYFYDIACGVWLDCFEQGYISENIIKEHLDNGKKVCIVSPELHKRDFKDEWQEFKKMFKNLNTSDNLMLCTDYPKKAREFFND